MATPNNMPKTDPLAGISASKEAKGLYEDPAPAFQPALDFVNKQRTQANERYAQNKADIANIFGTLTQVNTESQNRVNQQFQESITNQQLATAQRVAEARTGAAQTQQAAIRAADERGGGPMGNLAASPVAVEAERGIANQNALQTIFAGQQGAIQQQTIQDLLAGQRGFGYQQLAANQQLGRNLEDVLMGLTGQETGIRGDIAEARIGARGQVRQAGYNEVLARREAAANLAAARASASGKPKQYSGGITGIFERISDQAGPASAKGFSESIAKILSGSDQPAGPGLKPKAPTSISEAVQRWLRANPGMEAYQGYATDAFADIFSKTIPAAPRNNTPGQRGSLPYPWGQG